MNPHQEALLDLLRAARGAPADFRREALAWLERGIGFDGAVWGRGRRLAGGQIAIEGAELFDRPRSLLADFGEVAGLDPVSRAFGNDPQGIWNIRVASRYDARPTRPVGAYLRRHHVGQFLLCGTRLPEDGALAWLTLYREDPARPFSPQAEEFAAFAVPFVLLAGASQPLPPPAQLASDPTNAEALSRREAEVAAAYAAGRSYKAIARELELSPATVRSHLLSIFRKLGVHNKIELHRRLVER